MTPSAGGVERRGWKCWRLLELVEGGVGRQRGLRGVGSCAVEAAVLAVRVELGGSLVGLELSGVAEAALGWLKRSARRRRLAWTEWAETARLEGRPRDSPPPTPYGWDQLWPGNRPRAPWQKDDPTPDYLCYSWHHFDDDYNRVDFIIPEWLFRPNQAQ